MPTDIKIGMDWRGDGHRRRHRRWQGTVLRIANVVAWIVGLLLPFILFGLGFVLYKTWAREAGNALMLAGAALGGVMILVVTRSPIRAARQAQWQAWQWPQQLGLRAGSVRRPGPPGQAQRQRGNGSQVPLAITLHEQVVAQLDAFAAEQGLTREEAVNRILAERLGESESEG